MRSGKDKRVCPWHPGQVLFTHPLRGDGRRFAGAVPWLLVEERTGGYSWRCQGASLSCPDHAIGARRKTSFASAPGGLRACLNQEVRRNRMSPKADSSHRTLIRKRSWIWAACHYKGIPDSRNACLSRSATPRTSDQWIRYSRSKESPCTLMTGRMARRISGFPMVSLLPVLPEPTGQFFSVLMVNEQLAEFGFLDAAVPSGNGPP